MHPSPSIRGTTRVTKLPDAGREEMLAAAGLSTSAHWHELDYLEQGFSYEEAAELAALDEAEERGFLADGGWMPVAKKNNRLHDGGLTSHRGVLQGDEYVDADELKVMVERELGFTIEQVHSVYRQGPLSTEQRELRGQIDARLLALSRSGGSMLALARIFGWTIKTGGKGDSCDTMERALKRARVQAALAKSGPPAPPTIACFKCGERTTAAVRPDGSYARVGACCYVERRR